MPDSRVSDSLLEVQGRCSFLASTLTANIRERRGSLVDIRVPLFVDKETVVPFGLSAPPSNGHVGESHRMIPVHVTARYE